MRSLKHGNLIALTEVFETKNSLYMVMELLEGGNLLEILNKNGPFKEKHAVSVMY
jgi:serine/threonine protein kinase